MFAIAVFATLAFLIAFISLLLWEEKMIDAGYEPINADNWTPTSL